MKGRRLHQLAERMWPREMRGVSPRSYDVATKLLFAVGAPVGGLVIYVGSEALTAFGPEMLAGNWVAEALLSLLGFAGMCLVVFTELRYDEPVFGWAGLAVLAGMIIIAESVEEQAFHRRGEITTCTVRDVDERVVSSGDTGWGATDWGSSPSPRTTTHYYDYRLACADPRVREMTTNSPVAEQGGRIDAYHDPAGRLKTRPAAAVDDPRSTLELGTAVSGLGIALRFLYELGVPPFHGGWARLRRLRRLRRRTGKPVH